MDKKPHVESIHNAPAPKVHTYTVTFPVIGEDKLSETPAEIDVEEHLVESAEAHGKLGKDWE